MRLDPRDIALEGSALLMHLLAILLFDIVFTRCLTLVSLVLLPAKLPQKG